jgi:hypothetical protein
VSDAVKVAAVTKLMGFFYVLCCAYSSFIVKSNRTFACMDVLFYSGNLNGEKKKTLDI